MAGHDPNTRHRGPILVGGQDGGVLGNQVNVWDGALSVNTRGMKFNTRKAYEEKISADKIYPIWEDLGRPIYFEVNVTCSDYYRVTLMAVKNWADQTELERLDGGLLCKPGQQLKIEEEEFTNLLIEVCSDATDVCVSMYASGFIPDNEGVNQFRKKIDMNEDPK